jgi:hypothetical protein
MQIWQRGNGCSDSGDSPATPCRVIDFENLGTTFNAAKTTMKSA